MVIPKVVQQFSHKTCAATHIENDTVSRWRQSYECIDRSMGGLISKLIQKFAIVGVCPIAVGQTYLVAVLLRIIPSETGIQAGGLRLGS